MTANFSASPAMADSDNTSAVGLHLLVDFYDARHLDDLSIIEDALRRAARSCGATLLDVRLHSFGEGSGVTGVALLAESHISIHTWPEAAYAAIDIFMCGKLDPRRALPTLRTAFLAASERVQEVQRGGKRPR
ncbi:adenosylmethionine decarboxylase [Pleomorphomonas oryzae]|uniref:adenosylmethionine decarboxylase n=1 Tax=Pleomorphomonas oryzae TaxID=261934 RepID=UPI001AEC5E18|nr:adenosylmethionine decarboxylase [Pleomorphomonas oryzae]